MVEKYKQLFEQLQKRFLARRKNQSPPREDRAFVTAASRVWFEEYREGFRQLGVSGEDLLEVDKNMRKLIILAASSARRSQYQGCINAIKKTTDKFITNAQVVEWENAKKFTGSGNKNVIEALRNLDEDLERRYLQVLSDIGDQTRISYAGTANELREVVRIVLHAKAPNEKVEKMPWFELERISDKNLPKQPTQAERVRYILEARKSSKGAVDQVQEEEQLIDALIGRVVRSSYGRINVSVHAIEDRSEIERCLRYVDAFLLDIL